MQHIKLFEDFLDENTSNEVQAIEESQKSDALIDMLSNSMEHYSLAKEFVDDAMKKIPGFKKSDASLLKDIFNKYWDLDAKKRTDYTTKDWEEWLRKSTHGWVLNESTEETQVTESVYPSSRGGKIDSWGKNEEIGRMDLKYKGGIIGTLLVWMQPSYDFNTKGYDETNWEVGASYTTYPVFNSSGSTGSGVWTSSGHKSKEDAIKAGKDFMKNVKLS